MVTTIRKWGNSQGLRLSKELLHAARMQPGDQVEVTLKDGAILITPVRVHRGSHSLEELVSQIPEGYQPEETGWGGPAGKEAW